MKGISITSPATPVPWQVKHGLGKLPSVVIVSMKSAGMIWWTSADKTFVYLLASDVNLAGVLYVE
jgi:hypothetical protein